MRRLNATIKPLSISIFLLIVCCFISAAQVKPILGNRTVGIQPKGSILVPSNQLLQPEGFQVYIPGRPVDLVLSKDEKLLFVKNMRSLDLIRVADRTVLQTLPYPASGASPTGIYLSSDNHRVYVTDATSHIHVASVNPSNVMQWERSITLPAPETGGVPVPCGFAVNEAEDKLWVTLSRSNAIAVVNLKDTSDIRLIPVGIAPYDIILGTSGKAYVTNLGGRRPAEGEVTYTSSGSQVLVDSVTGIANHGSVSVINLEKTKKKK